MIRDYVDWRIAEQRKNAECRALTPKWGDPDFGAKLKPALDSGACEVMGGTIFIGANSLTSIGTLAPRLQLSRHLTTDHLATSGRESHVTIRMIEMTLEKGKAFSDAKNFSNVYVLEGGFASGKSILVAENPITGLIKTVITGYKLVRPRFVPIPD